MLDNKHVFIVGLPRTGSTLLRTLLNRSDCISIAAETHFLHKYARLGKQKRLLRFGDLNGERGVDLFLDDLFNPRRAVGKDFWGWLNRNCTREDFRERILKTDRSDFAIFELFIQISAERKKGGVRPDLILGEKTEANLYYVPQLLQWYPDARIIHTFRDPRGIFVSALKLVKDGKWGVKTRIPSKLPPKATENLLAGMMAVYILRFWRDAALLHKQYTHLYPNQYLLLRFEDLLQNPETQIRKVCEFIQVPFIQAMVEEVPSIGSSFTERRIMGGVGFERSVADRWRGQINPLTKTWFTLMTRRHLDTFGYGL